MLLPPTLTTLCTHNNINHPLVSISSCLFLSTLFGFPVAISAEGSFEDTIKPILVRTTVSALANVAFHTRTASFKECAVAVALQLYKYSIEQERRGRERWI